MTMVAGQVIYADGEFPNIDRPAFMERVSAAAERLQADVAADPACAELPIVQLTRAGKH
jgi:hypothetical protein